MLVSVRAWVKTMLTMYQERGEPLKSAAAAAARMYCCACAEKSKTPPTFRSSSQFLSGSFSPSSSSWVRVPVYVRHDLIPELLAHNADGSHLADHVALGISANGCAGEASTAHD